jgi:hypothetical protein
MMNGDDDSIKQQEGRYETNDTKICTRRYGLPFGSLPRGERCADDHFR